MADFHHPLTQEQAWWARSRFNEWLGIKERHELNATKHERAPEADDEYGQAYRKTGERRWKDGDLTFLRADIDHSALLFRLLTGKPALDEPPPVLHAYPVYPDA